jgi:hypothetical protein
LFAFDREVTIAELAKDGEASKRLAEYLAPLVQEAKQQQERTRTDTKRKTHERVETVKLRIPEFSFAGVELGSPGDYEVKTTDKDELEKATGSRFTWDVSTKTWNLHSIRAFKRAEGREVIRLDQQEVYALQLDADGDSDAV